MLGRILLGLWLGILIPNSIVCSQPSLQLVTFEKAPVIDGFLEEDEWNSGDSVDQFIQLEPERGKPSSRRTIVYAGQHEKNIYFMFICYVNSAGEIVGRIQRRDQADDSDDVIGLVLDTYFDRRTALLFIVNPLGTLSDAKITDDGKNVDFNWDTEWHAQVGVYDHAWIVEIKISLENIQFSPESNRWGINFARVIRANQETCWWSEVTESFRISQSGILTGVQPGKQKNSHLILFPYGTLRYENSDISEVYNEVKADAGVDLRYDLGSNLALNLTYNPDFATVEGDQELINLTPWELRFPDKRLFFQDGNEMFNTRISTFYSRRIGDLQWGGKMIGKAGKYQFNGLFARTDENKITGESPSWHNVLRMKRDIFKSSLLGMTYSDKITDSIYYRSLSFDYVLNLGKTWNFTGQFVGSGPGDFASHSAWFVRFARENNIYHYHIRYSNTGRNFQENVNQTGFVPDDDRHELDGDVRYRWWINKKVRYLDVSGRNNIFWSQEGILRSWYVTYGSRLYMQNRLSLDIAYNNEYKLLDMNYYNHFYQVKFGYNTDEATFGEFGYSIGRNFDRDFQLWEGTARILIFKRLNISYEINILKYDPDPEGNSTVINVIGADYFFNKDLWIRIFTQNNSHINKYYFYGLFGWRFKPPFGALYLIFSSDRFDIFEPELTNMQSKILFLKATYPIQIF